MNINSCRNYTRASEPPNGVKMDIHDPQYPSRVWLMIFYGLLDSMWQTTAYWLMGAMSNDPAKLAVFTGFCKISFGSQAKSMVLMIFYIAQISASSPLGPLLYGVWTPYKSRKFSFNLAGSS
jgi:hypothetical protein